MVAASGPRYVMNSEEHYSNFLSKAGAWVRGGADSSGFAPCSYEVCESCKAAFDAKMRETMQAARGG